jgi:hypothetical protein
MSIKMNAASAAAILAALAVMPAVYAHGHVSEITANGETVPGTTPEWKYNDASTPGWYAANQDNGFVEPSSFGSADIICHKVLSIHTHTHTRRLNNSNHHHRKPPPASPPSPSPPAAP